MFRLTQHRVGCCVRRNSVYLYEKIIPAQIILYEVDIRVTWLKYCQMVQLKLNVIRDKIINSEGPFWKTNSHSNNKKSPSILWGCNFRHRVQQKAENLQNLEYYFETRCFSSGRKRSGSQPNLQQESHPSSAVCDILFNTFTGSLNIWRFFALSATGKCIMPW
jgi:hypothetical protein